MVRFASLSLVATAIAVVSVCTGNTEALPHVNPSVHRTLRVQDTVNLILTMQDGTGSALASVQEAEFSSRGEKIASLVESLEKTATQSQQAVAGLLAQESESTQLSFSKVTSFWITNQLYIQDASVDLLARLMQEPSIKEISEEITFELPKPLDDNIRLLQATNANTTTTLQWGVNTIQAADAWAKGITGEGVVVAAIDSGARGTHEALKDNFLGAYGWFDPEMNAAEPYDNAGHGSHVIGSMVGRKGTGVAPGSKWMACKACRNDTCLLSEMLACMQFVLCPTDTDGKNADCSKAPHIVNNSWSGSGAEIQAVIDAWRAASIIPVFANGNVLPDCSTVEEPGDSPKVIGVGATNEDNSILWYSATGPATRYGNIIKPDVAAPGGAVTSAWFTGDADYHTTSGTSMATPHVAGVIALLLNAHPGLTYDQVYDALTTTTTQNLIPTNKACGGIPEGTYPNNQFGYGLVNALNAVNHVL